MTTKNICLSILTYSLVNIIGVTFAHADSTIQTPQGYIEILSQLSRDSDVRVRTNVAQNKYISTAIAEKLVKDNQTVRFALAQNKNIPSTIADTLASDLDEDVQFRALFNPNISEATFKKYMGSKNDLLRSALASYPSAEPAFLQKLLNDKDNDVRRDAIANPHFPIEMLYKLDQNNRSTQEIISHKENIPLDLLTLYSKSKDESIRKNIAENPNTPTAIIDQLATDKAQGVRESALCHPNISSQVLEKAALSSSFQYCMASHPKLSIQVQKKLMHSDDIGIHSALAENKNANNQVLEYLLKNNPIMPTTKALSNSNINPENLTYFLKSDDFSYRSSIAENTKTPVQLLTILAKDSEPVVIQAVARNPATPVNILKELSTSKDIGTRMSVASWGQ